MLKRIGLFILGNIAIFFVLNLVLTLLQSLGLVNPGDSAFFLISAIVFGFGGAFISLWMSKWIAKRFMGVQLVDKQVRDARLKWVYETVARQAHRANIKMPEVGVFQHASPNAFATGSSRNNSLVAVSSGLLNVMNDDEVEAVLAHEVAHIANGDMVTMTLLQGLLNVFVIIIARLIGTLIDRVVFKNEEGYGAGYFIGYFVSSIILTILASFVIAWYSRKREFKADSGGAYLAGKDKMIAALTKLKTQVNAEPLPDEVAAFGISSAPKMMALLATHPPLDERIASLRQLKN